MSGNIIDFPAVERRRPDDAPAPANDTRERADAEWVQALNFSTILIAGAIGFLAGAIGFLAGSLSFAAIAFVIATLTGHA